MLKKDTESDILEYILDDYVKDDVSKKIVLNLATAQKMRNKEYGYVAGLKDGVTFYDILKKDNPKINCDYIKNKDITIMFDFHDNDFGNTVLAAAQEYVNVYNNLLYKINLYSAVEGAEQMTNSYIQNLNAIEDVNVIANFISTAYVAKDVLQYLYDSVDVIKPDFQNIKETAFDNEDYLGLNNTENYHIGTYEEIEKYVVDTYKELQSKGEGKTLDTCWLNGEVLFISIKNGEMKTWVQ